MNKRYSELFSASTLKSTPFERETDTHTHTSIYIYTQNIHTAQTGAEGLQLPVSSVPKNGSVLVTSSGNSLD